MVNKLTTKQLAEAVGLTYGRIIQLIQSGEIQAERFGRDYSIDDRYVEILKSRPERRGRPKNQDNVRRAA